MVLTDGRTRCGRGTDGRTDQHTPATSVQGVRTTHAVFGVEYSTAGGCQATMADSPRVFCAWVMVGVCDGIVCPSAHPHPTLCTPTPTLCTQVSVDMPDMVVKSSVHSRVMLVSSVKLYK